MIEPLLGVPVTLKEKRKLWNARNYQWNRKKILERKAAQRRAAGIPSREELNQ